jgi:hypothetical protein
MPSIFLLLNVFFSEKKNLFPMKDQDFEVGFGGTHLWSQLLEEQS